MRLWWNLATYQWSLFFANPELATDGVSLRLPNQKLDKFRSFGNPLRLFGKPCQNFTKLLRSGLNDLLLRRLSPRVSLMVLTKIDVDRPMRISDGGSDINLQLERFRKIASLLEDWSLRSIYQISLIPYSISNSKLFKLKSNHPQGLNNLMKSQ